MQVDTQNLSGHQGTQIIGNYKSEIPIQDTDRRQPEPKTKIVIVGAGLAGLAAAQRLYWNGVTDIIILEAQNRIGGRVHSHQYVDSFVELGAQWLHGAEDNPIFEWLNSMSLLSDREDALFGMTGFYCTDNKSLIDPNIINQFLEMMIDIKACLFNDQTFASKSCPLESAYQVFRREFERRLYLDINMSSKRNLLNNLFDWFMRFEAIENGCDSMDEVSMSSYTDWKDFSDGALLNFRYSYNSLLNWFQKSIPNLIHLNKEVTNIDIMACDDGKTRKAIVRYRNSDDGCISSIECSSIILTCSIGFLKYHLDTLFSPQLPIVKRKLIKAVGFGTVNKIFLEFEKPFWAQTHDSEPLGFKLVWNQGQLGDNFPCWAQDILAFDGVRNQPNILVGWIGGTGASLMEAETNEFIGHTCLSILKQFLPTSLGEPSKLISCLPTRWHSNKFIRGSYSFRSMIGRDFKIDRLEDPVYLYEGELTCEKENIQGDPVLMFAGEATAGELYSTTHGAIMSGWREADRLISEGKQTLAKNYPSPVGFETRTISKCEVKKEQKTIGCT